MTVAAVGAHHIVIGPEVCTETHGHRLFSAVHVECALNVAECGLPVRLFLEQADTPHRAVHRFERVRARFQGLPLRFSTPRQENVRRVRSVRPDRAQVWTGEPLRLGAGSGADGLVPALDVGMAVEESLHDTGGKVYGYQCRDIGNTEIRAPDVLAFTETLFE